MLATVTRCPYCGRTHTLTWEPTERAMKLRGGFTHEATCPDSGVRLVWGFRPGYTALAEEEKRQEERSTDDGLNHPDHGIATMPGEDRRTRRRGRAV
jgi:hypothetical protein